MASSLLASLSLAGIIQRAGRHRTLRVSPRFMAHAEQAATELASRGVQEPAEVLRSALCTWDEYRHDPDSGARFLLRIMEDREQLGSLRPVFPPLEQFVAAA